VEARKPEIEPIKPQIVQQFNETGRKKKTENTSRFIDVYSKRNYTRNRLGTVGVCMRVCVLDKSLSQCNILLPPPT
jgi:hypothetical protein